MTQDVVRAAGGHGTDRRSSRCLGGRREVGTRPRREGRESSQPRPPWWRDWRKLAAAGAGGLLLIWLGIWVVVRDKEGKEAGARSVPEGGSVTRAGNARKAARASAGLNAAKSPRQDRRYRQGTRQAARPWNLPPGSPPPAIAPFDAAKAKEHQAAWAKHLGVPVEMENSIGMRFVLIPPGEFDMGSTEEEVAKLLEEAKATNQPSWYIERLPSEAPKHRVRITKPFYLGRCEVTQAEYERVVGSNPSKFKDDPTCPVEMVNWDEASAFCRKLGELPQEQAAHAEYRLPTEAEWEYACRAGTTTTVVFG